MIIGSGGAGKSTLARQLGKMLDLPVIHLDAVHWQPGWVAMPKDEWCGKVAEMTQGERWIIDGNYGGTLPARLAVADTIIFLDYPWWLCLWRVLRRRVQYHGRTRPDLSPGCPEQLDWEFLKWVCVDFPRHSRGRILQLVQEHGGHAHLIQHQSPRETRRWLAEISQDKAHLV